MFSSALMILRNGSSIVTFRSGPSPFSLILAACVGLASSAGGAWAGPAAFHKSDTLQGISFHVQSSGEGSQQQLTITTTGGKQPFTPIRQTVNGRVVGAVAADLTGNGQPEIYVFVQGAGSGSYGELVAYAVGSTSVLSPISLQELSGPMAQGYRGHDRFEVVEGCLVRHFPLYKAGDTNAKATGGERQICYKLKQGEAGWILRPTSVLNF